MASRRSETGNHIIRKKTNVIKVKPNEQKRLPDPRPLRVLEISSKTNSMVDRAMAKVVSMEESKQVRITTPPEERHRRIASTWKYENYTYIDPIFLGDTVYVVGGGPSLKGFDFNLLKDKTTIAINRAFLHLPFAQVLYWSDTRFYEWFAKEIDLFKGIKVTCRPQPKKADIINLLNTGKTGLETMAYGLRDGGNSGYAAINLAYHLGARKIVLMGFDMQTNGKETHWHEGYSSTANTDTMERLMVPNFSTLVEPLEKRKVKIYNASLDSILTCFPKISLEEALSFE
jgi:uncharacterized Rossmann fold enzyme